jgi:hypothetical protein
MNLAILDGILHGALKPAFIGKLDPKTLAGFIRLAKSFKPSKLNDLCGQQAALLHHFPNLSSQIEEYPALPIEQLPFESQIPEPQTLLNQFFRLLISNEIVLRYNSIVHASVNWKHPIDQEYQVTKALRDLKVLAQQAKEEYNEASGLPEHSGQPSLYPYLVLKLQAINLYFSLQETFRSFLSSTISLEDFYTLELLESTQNIIALLPNSELSKPFVKGKSKPETITIGFNGDKVKLNSVLFQLCRHINLLDQSQCTLNHLMDFFTTKKVTPGQFKIYLGCETVQFRFVLDCLNSYFSNFSIASIEKAETFYSKNGKLLTAQNIYSSRKETPKQWEEIREIINQMQ